MHNKCGHSRQCLVFATALTSRSLSQCHGTFMHNIENLIFFSVVTSRSQTPVVTKVFHALGCELIIFSIIYMHSIMEFYSTCIPQVISSKFYSHLLLISRRLGWSFLFFFANHLILVNIRNGSLVL